MYCWIIGCVLQKEPRAMQWRIIPRTGRGSDKRGNNRVLEFVVEEVGVVLAARRLPDGGPAVPWAIR